MNRMLLMTIVGVIAFLGVHGDAGAQIWTPTSGPPGEVVSVALKGDVAYVGTGKSGAYRSTDRGRRWEPIKQFKDSVVLVIAPLESSVYMSMSGGSIYRSTDQGVTWDRIVPGERYSAAVDFTSINGKTYIGMAGGRIFSSSDGGGVWQELPTPLRATALSGLEAVGDYLFVAGYGEGVHRSSDQGKTWTLLEELGIFVTTIASNGTTLYAGSGPKVYRSTDFGETWRPSGSEIQDDVRRIIVDGDDLIVGAGNISTSLGRVYRSTDDGTTFVRVIDTIQVHIPQYYAPPPYPFQSLAVDAGLILLGPLSGALYRMDVDDGALRPSHEGLRNSSIVALKSIGSVLYTAASNGASNKFTGGVYSTTNGGDHWARDREIVSSMVVDDMLAQGAALYIVGVDGLYRRSPGTSWKRLPLDLVGAGKGSLAASDNAIYAALSSIGVLRSTDNGETWSSVNNGLVPFDVSDIVVEGDGDVYTLNGIFLYRSSDQGESWSETAGLYGVNAVTVIAAHGPDIYMATNLGIAHSSNDGREWDLSVSGIVENAPIVTTLLVDDSAVYAGTSAGVYASTDRGATWVEFGQDLRMMDVTAMAVTDEGFYAGTSGDGVYRLAKPSWVPEGRADLASALRITPNPLAETAVAEFTLNRPAAVRATLTDVLGRVVRTLVDDALPVGHYRYMIDRHSLPAGVYFCRLQVGEGENIVAIMVE